MSDAAHDVPRAGVSGPRRWSRRLSTALILGGVAVLAWVLVVWIWNDPFTSLYTRWEQRALGAEYETLVKESARRRPPSGTSREALQRSIAGQARDLRASAPIGAAIGRLEVPRLGLSMIAVNGTDTATLRKGPGRHPTTSMPGEGGLVYIAGHRTTYAAPFARIDRLRKGDAVRLEMPYASFAYRVTDHRIVDDQDLSVLESRGREEIALQACHPRFMATQRYVVWARLVEVTPRGGTPFATTG